MKRWIRVSVLCMLLVSLVLVSPLQAMAAVAPGDTVLIYIPYSYTSPFKSAEIKYVLSADLTFVSITSAEMQIQGDADNAVLFSLTGVTGGTAKLTVMVNNGAVANQTVKIISVQGAISSTEKVSIGTPKTHTIEVNVAEVWGPWEVVTPATCLEKGQEKSVSNLTNEKFRDIDPLGHDWGEWAEKTPATCAAEGLEMRVCKRDALHTETRPIPKLEHDWGEWAVKTAATHAAAGEEERVCKRDARHKETREIPIAGHLWGDWGVKTPATCLVKGVEERVCILNDMHVETREIAALGHYWDYWVVKTPATCAEAGEEERSCKNDPAHKEVRDIAALGHDWGDWGVKFPATCTADGQEERVCKRDAAHIETRDIPALGHDWGGWVVKTAPTCKAKGLEERLCKHDPAHKEARDIPQLAHQEGPWEIVKEATKEAPGLRVQKCLVGGEILKQEEIPYEEKRVYYYDNTASTQGFRFRDIKPELTDKWYMFTPVDLSKDGEQVIPIIASNLYYIGNVKLLVGDGSVNIAYEMAKGVNVKSEFLTLFPNLDAVNSVEPSELGGTNPMSFGQPISIEEGLGGDTRVLLFAHFVVDYHDELKGVTPFRTSGKEYKSILESLQALMD